MAGKIYKGTTTSYQEINAPFMYAHHARITTGISWNTPNNNHNYLDYPLSMGTAESFSYNTASSGGPVPAFYRSSYNTRISAGNMGPYYTSYLWLVGVYNVPGCSTIYCETAAPLGSTYNTLDTISDHPNYLGFHRNWDINMFGSNMATAQASIPANAAVFGLTVQQYVDNSGDNHSDYYTPNRLQLLFVAPTGSPLKSKIEAQVDAQFKAEIVKWTQYTHPEDLKNQWLLSSDSSLLQFYASSDNGTDFSPIYSGLDTIKLTTDENLYNPNTATYNGVASSFSFTYSESPGAVQTFTPLTLQTITFDPLSAGQNTINLTATASSGLPVTFTSSDPSIAEVNGSVLTVKASGTVSITASQAGDATYAPAPDVTQSLTITKQAQVITFNSLSDALVEDGDINLTATADSGLPVTYASSDPSIAEVNGSILTPKTSGTVSITASQGGDSTYFPAPDVVQSLFIDADTDNDGELDSTDTDDDNDGIPDANDPEPLKKFEVLKNQRTLVVEGATGQFGTNDMRGSVATVETATSSLSNELGEPIQQSHQGSSLFLDRVLYDTLLNGERVRPYIDLLLSQSNAVRVPVVGSEYDVYADKGHFYEGVVIEGDLALEGEFVGDINLSGSIAYNKSIEVVTENKTLSLADRSKILHIEPTGSQVTITLPVSAGFSAGYFIEVVNNKEGSYTLLQPETGTLRAKNPGLSQRYSAATVYWDGTEWYAIGDLTP